jgi:hypothetical protein
MAIHITPQPTLTEMTDLNTKSIISPQQGTLTEETIMRGNEDSFSNPEHASDTNGYQRPIEGSSQGRIRQNSRLVGSI